MVSAEASSNWGVCGTLSLAWGLVDEHVIDILPRKGVLACILPTPPRHQALGLLLRRALDECAELLVSMASLGYRLLWEPF
jgi:hypothetical protein